MARPKQRQEYPEWWERDPDGGPKREYGPDYRDPWGRHYMQSMPYWLYAWPLPSAFAGDRYLEESEYRDRGYRDPDYRDQDFRDRDRRSFVDRAADEVSSWFGDDDAERRRWRDRHRGKGPKGYARSDNRILEDVSDRLMEDGGVDASDIEVSVKDGEVTLSGSVTDRFEKRRAEDCADMVSGVRHTQNNLQIEEPARGQRA